MALNVSNLDLHIAEAVNNDLAVLLEHESALRDTVAKAVSGVVLVSRKSSNSTFRCSNDTQSIF